MARSVETNENAGSRKVRQAPIPAGWCTCTVVRRHESLLGGSESICLAGADGQPYEVKQEIEDDEKRGGVEDPSEVTSYAI